tara:strand:+ start:4137 stop:5051 length:915 start_codon:yes stop_codon:yes gene_type:complete
MSLDLTGLNAYSDENKMDLIKKSVLKGKTVSMITVQADIKSSAKINMIDSNLIATAGACGWTPAGTTILKQRDLSVASIKINEAICLEDLEKYYTQKAMNAGSYNESLPFEAIYAEEKADKVAALIEKVIWQGDVVSANTQLALSDGFIKLFSAGIGQITGNTGAVASITPANVIDVVDAMVDSMHVDTIDADDNVLFLGYEIYRMYTRAIRNANLYHYTADEKDFEIMIPGTNVKAVAVAGLNGTNKMYLSKASNYYFGTDLLNDSEDFRIFYSEDNDEVRFRTKWKQGVQVAFPELVVEFSL